MLQLAVHWGRLSPAVTAPVRGAVTGFTFVARIPSLLRHTLKSVYVCTRHIIGNTLVQHKMAKNSSNAAWHCVARIECLKALAHRRRKQGGSRGWCPLV